MKLAVSNIAWSVEDCAAAYGLLSDYGIPGLEIAPGLFLSGSADPFVPTDTELSEALRLVHESGLQLVSMQALLFGVEGAMLFGNTEERARFRRGLLRAIELANRAGIPNLVLGSPRQRQIPDTMDAATARAIAAEVLGALGDAAARAGTRLGMEFNPAAYGTNFLNTVEEAAELVEELHHPAVTLILDIGAMKMNGAFDTIEIAAARSAPYISHVHLSEPNLLPAPATSEDAARVMKALSATTYQGWFSIEMKRPTEHPLVELKSSLDRLVAAAAIAEGITPQ